MPDRDHRLPALDSYRKRPPTKPSLWKRLVAWWKADLDRAGRITHQHGQYL